MEWLDGNCIKVDIPERPKKITGTRFGAVLGKNKWNGQFKTWCEITRTYEEPFEDTKYTIAGKIIEPKQAEYMKTAYYMQNLVRPADIWGDDYFKITHGDFFPNDPIFGGMWDYVLKDEDRVTAVLEMKTSKRSEDWQNGIPEYYALQAALYAWLLKTEQVYMVASFLTDKDYDDPDSFVPSADNTIVVAFKVHERYPIFEYEHIKKAKRWWSNYVETGISPEYDPDKDADILNALHTISGTDIPTDMQTLIAEAEALASEISAHKAQFEEKEKRYKQVTDQLKKQASESLTDNVSKIDIAGTKYIWRVAKVESSKINTDKLKADGLYDKYAEKSETVRLTNVPRKD